MYTHIHPSIYPSFHPFIHSFIHPSIHPSIHTHLSHSIHPSRVHIDVPACMTGVTRFGQEREGGVENWVYSKDENITTMKDLRSFDALLTAKKEVKNFVLLEHVPAFRRVDIKGGRLEMEDGIFIMKNTLSSRAQGRNNEKE